MIIKQIVENNIGITDVVNDGSLTYKGYVHHSGFDFVPELLGNFCKFINEFCNRFGITDNSKIIEFGCGSGVLVNCFPNDCLYVGLDGNLEGGKFIKEKNNKNKNFISVDLTKDFCLEPYLKYDALFSFDFMEHLDLENISIVLNHMDNLLNKNGIMLSLIDTIELEAHRSNHPLPWWIDKINSLTNWQLVDACWRHQNRESYWWQLFEKTIPPFWQPNINNQMIVIYRK